MNKIIRNSILSMLAGIGISIGACFIGKLTEPVNYVGAMFVLGGLIFIDQWMVQKIFGNEGNKKSVLFRLPVYLLLAVLLIMVPLYVSMPEIAVRIGRSFGIAFLLLALWRFFTFTTVEEERIHKNESDRKKEM